MELDNSRSRYTSIIQIDSFSFPGFPGVIQSLFRSVIAAHEKPARYLFELASFLLWLFSQYEKGLCHSTNMANFLLNIQWKYNAVPAARTKMYPAKIPVFCHMKLKSPLEITALNPCTEYVIGK
jgi:hypothetical protein